MSPYGSISQANSRRIDSPWELGVGLGSCFGSWRLGSPLGFGIWSLGFDELNAQDHSHLMCAVDSFERNQQVRPLDSVHVQPAHPSAHAIRVFDVDVKFSG